jgi:hypothetical protein
MPLEPSAERCFFLLFFVFTLCERENEKQMKRKVPERSAQAKKQFEAATA